MTSGADHVDFQAFAGFQPISVSNKDEPIRHLNIPVAVEKRACQGFAPGIQKCLGQDIK